MPGMRSLVRSIARVLVCTFVAGLSLPAVSASHGADPDALTCPENVLVPGRSGDRVDGPAEATGTDHCLLCHWTRAVGSAAPMPPASADQILGPISVHGLSASSVPARQVAFDHPSRAPPASLQS